jgi:hypothetical protein
MSLTAGTLHPCLIPGTLHPVDASFKGRFLQWTPHSRDVSSSGRLIQGRFLQWTPHSRDVSSRGSLIQGRFPPVDASFKGLFLQWTPHSRDVSSSERLIQGSLRWMEHFIRGTHSLQKVSLKGYLVPGLFVQGYNVRVPNTTASTGTSLFWHGILWYAVKFVQLFCGLP